MKNNIKKEHWNYQGKTKKQVDSSIALFAWMVILAASAIFSYGVYHLVKMIVTHYLGK